MSINFGQEISGQSKAEIAKQHSNSAQEDRLQNIGENMLKMEVRY